MIKKICITLILLTFSYGVYAVSIKQCLFSSMTGVVNFEGKPAAGVKLVRMVNYNKDVFDETVTDEQGNFHFPAIFRNNYAGVILPMEFVVLQEITAHVNNEEVEMWSGTKRSPEENSESRGKPLIVKCDLSQPDVEGIIVNRNIIFSRCTWDVEPDPERYIPEFL